MENVYERVRAKIDEMGTGFPKTESGVELELLKEIYTVEHAEYAAELSVDWETPSELAQRMGRDVGEVSAELMQMSQKGLCYRKTVDDKIYYKMMPWTIGILEFQVNRGASQVGYRATMGRYFGEAFAKTMWANKMPIFRYLPINKELVVESDVLECDDIMKVIDSKNRIAVMECVCAQGTALRGEKCKHADDHPTECCLSCNDYADYFVGNGDARYITKEYAKKLVESAGKSGLCIQVANAETTDTICMCCKCCCGPLRLLRTVGGAGKEKASNYYAVIDDSLCINCKLCVERCNTDAVVLAEDGSVSINLDNCVGCSLCASTCPTKAIKLVRKSDDKLSLPLKDLDVLQAHVARERLAKG